MRICAIERWLGTQCLFLTTWILCHSEGHQYWHLPHNALLINLGRTFLWILTCTEKVHSEWVLVTIIIYLYLAFVPKILALIHWMVFILTFVCMTMKTSSLSDIVTFCMQLLNYNQLHSATRIGSFQVMVSSNFLVANSFWLATDYSEYFSFVLLIIT